MDAGDGVDDEGGVDVDDSFLFYFLLTWPHERGRSAGVGMIEDPVGEGEVDPAQKWEMVIGLMCNSGWNGGREEMVRWKGWCCAAVGMVVAMGGYAAVGMKRRDGDGAGAGAQRWEMEMGGEKGVP